MTIAEKAIEIARAKIGMHEEGGENMGPIVEWAFAPWSKSKVGFWSKWCAAFVCTCFLEAGSASIRKLASTSCDMLWKNCQKAGYAWINFKTPTQKRPEAGDIVFYGTSKDLYHVGLITEVNENKITVIEGNDNNSVRESVHPINQPSIFGFARIP